MTLRRRASRPLLVLVAVLALSGCVVVSGDKAPPPPSPVVRAHDPSRAEINSLRRQLKAIDGVQSITEFSYQNGSFVYSAATDATFTTTATSRQEMVTILDAAYRLTWYRTDLAMGGLIYVVQNPKTEVEVGAPDLGFDVVSVGPNELLERYGPAPTTSAEPR